LIPRPGEVAGVAQLAAKSGNELFECLDLARMRNRAMHDYRQRDHMTYEAINFGKKFGLFDEQWQPKVIAEMNDYQFKLVRLQGDFIWHDHKYG
jgi:hypothetical protein